MGGEVSPPWIPRVLSSSPRERDGMYGASGDLPGTLTCAWRSPERAAASASCFFFMFFAKVVFCQKPSPNTFPFLFTVRFSHTRTAQHLESLQEPKVLAKNLGLSAEPQLHVVQPA